MKTTDQIRLLLDFIDSLESNNNEVNNVSDNRFLQIQDLISDKQYSTQPDEQIADISAVTVQAGGGVNGPKHPMDIRVKDPRGFE